jgi:hypothetical protein
MAVATMTTVGYGDVTPTLGNNIECGFAVFTQIIGMTIFSYSAAVITTVMTHQETMETRIEE